MGLIKPPEALRAQRRGSMYIVRFIRKDHQPCEEYYYHKIEDAKYHLSLFVNDDSDLFNRIELVNDDNEELIESL